MPLPSRALASATAPDRAERLGWLLLIPLGCLVLGQALLALHGVLPVLDGGLIDTDSHMRLSRVLHLHESGAWFDATYPRINPPDGHVQHWTRPLDALLLAGAWLLQPFLGFATGLHVWGVLISPVCLALSILALNWAMAPVLDRDVRMIACLLLLLQPGVVGYSSLGRPDHHSLLFPLFIMTIGFTARFLLDAASRRAAVIAGAVAALGIWVSTEALIVLAGALAALGLYWLAGDRAMATRSRDLAAWTTAFLALALLLERGPEVIAAVETDRLSILHVMALGLVALFWSAIVALETHAGATRARRLSSAVAGVAAVALILSALFPELLRGPLGEVDPLYKELRFSRIAEVQPLIAWPQLAAGELAVVSKRLIQAVGIAALALPFLVLLIRAGTGRQRRFWVGLAVPLALVLPLAAYQIRWSGYAQILLVVPYGALIDVMVGWIATSGLAERSRAVVRPLVTVLAMIWPIAASSALPQREIETAHQACPLTAIARALGALGEGGPRTIMTIADYGPELLYRTPHRVLSIPNHRPQPGFTVTHETLGATEERNARTHLARSGADWILLCPSRAEESFFDAGGRGTTLYRRLVDGKPPAWLRPLDLPDAVGDRARLFEVRLDRFPGRWNHLPSGETATIIGVERIHPIEVSRPAVPYDRDPL